MALRAVVDHPKTMHLAQLLGQKNRGFVVGQLELLWHFTGRFTPQGNVGKYEDAVIEAWIGWQGDAGALIGAFVTARWLDLDDAYRLLVHDWHEGCDEATKKAVSRKHLRMIGEMRAYPDGKPDHVPDARQTPLDPRYQPFKDTLVSWWSEANQSDPKFVPWGSGTGKALIGALEQEPHLDLEELTRRLAFRYQAIQIGIENPKGKGDVNAITPLYEVIRRLADFANGPVNTFRDKL